MLKSSFKPLFLGKIKNGKLLDRLNQPCPDKIYGIGGLEGSEGENAEIHQVVLDEKCNLISNFQNSYLIVENLLSLIDNTIKLVDQQTALIDKMVSGILPANSGGNIKNPTFDADVNKVKVELTNIKTEVNKVVEKIKTDKKKFF